MTPPTICVGGGVPSGCDPKTIYNKTIYNKTSYNKTSYNKTSNNSFYIYDNETRVDKPVEEPKKTNMKASFVDNAIAYSLKAVFDTSSEERNEIINEVCGDAEEMNIVIGWLAYKMNRNEPMIRDSAICFAQEVHEYSYSFGAKAVADVVRKAKANQYSRIDFSNREYERLMSRNNNRQLAAYDNVYTVGNRQFLGIDGDNNDLPF